MKENDMILMNFGSLVEKEEEKERLFWINFLHNV